MLWLCIHCSKLSLEVFSQNYSEPVIIVEQDQIYCCNELASDAGIYPGLSVVSAQALCPNLKIYLRDASLESKTLLDLARACYRFTPAIVLLNDNSLLLEIRSSLKLFKGLNSLINLIEEEITQYQLTYILGLADTPKAAQLMAFQNRLKEAGANHQTYHYIDSQTGEINNNGFFKQLLDSIPLTYLDCSDNIKKKLARTGFRTLGQLYSLPMAALARRYGRDFVTYLKCINGELNDPQIYITLPESFEQYLEFDDALNNTESILWLMERMLQSLSSYLRGKQMYCQSFTWSLYPTGDRSCDQVKNNVLNLEIHLSQARWDLKHFFHLTRIRMEAIRLNAPITATRLSVSDLKPADYFYADLLPMDKDYLSHQDGMTGDQAIRTLIDTLSARIDSETLDNNTRHKNKIYQISHHRSYIPEQASQVSKLFTGETHYSSRKLRPAWLLSKPSPIKNHHQFLYWRGRLTLLQGPERIEGNWWCDPISRDYYLARHQNDTVYWIYRDRQTQQWFIHGVFA